MKTRTRPSGAYLVVAAAVIDVLFSGFVNLVPVSVGGLYPATMVLDLLTAVMLLGMLNRFIGNHREHVPAWVAGLFALALVYVALFPASGESVLAKVLSLRSEVMYAFVAAFIFWRITSREELRRLYRLAINCAVILAAIGIGQFLLRNHLPIWLLVSRDTTVFGYFGTDLTRATGLVGNTIVYATVMVLFYCQRLVALVRGDRSIRWAYPHVVLLGAAVLCTFSRVPIAGAAVATLLAGVYWTARTLTRRADALVGLVAVVVLAAVGVTVLAPGWWRQVSNSFLLRGLFSGENASVRGSNAGHNADVLTGLAAFHAHPLFGVGVATQTQNSQYNVLVPYISDGAFWSVLAEGGLILVCAYAVALALSAGWLLRPIADDQARTIRAGWLLFVAFETFFAIYLDSAILGKAPLVLTWVLFGIAAAHRRRGQEMATESSDDVEVAPVPGEGGVSEVDVAAAPGASARRSPTAAIRTSGRAGGKCVQVAPRRRS